MSQTCKVIYYNSNTSPTEKVFRSLCNHVRASHIEYVKLFDHLPDSYPLVNVIDSDAVVDPSATRRNPILDDVLVMISPTTTINVSFGPNELADHFDEALVQSIPPQALGGFAVNGICSVLGNHSLMFEDPFTDEEISMKELRVSLSLWHYVTPLDHDRFLDGIMSGAEMVRFRCELESILGKLNVGVFYDL